MNKQSALLLAQHFDTALESPDGIKKLRELILTLAMQGKLVSQDPNDQPASELLKEIQAEKERLIKEGKIKKQKELPPIKPEDLPAGKAGVPYKVPTGWEWTRLGEIGLVGSSSRVHERDWTTVGVPFYRAREIVKLNKYGYVENELYITEEMFNELSKNGLVPEANDIMLTGVGTIGIPYIVRNTDRFYFKDASVLIFKNYYKMNSKFLENLFKSQYWINTIHLESMGTTVHTLTISRANETLVPLPPLAEQKRIVAKIEELMALCDKLEAQRNARNEKRLAVHTSAINRLLTAVDKPDFDSAWQFITRNFDPLYSVKENVAELKKAILTLAMQGKLIKQDPKDQPASELLKEIQAEKERLIKEGKIKKQKELPPIKPEDLPAGKAGVPYQVPEGWVWARLINVVDVRDGTHDTPKYVDQGIPLITSKNLYTNTLSFDDIKFISDEDHQKIKERSKVDKGDILFAMIGSIGNPVIVDTSIEFSIKNVALFKFYSNGKPFNRFVHLFLHLAQDNMKSISSGAVQSFVSLGFLREYPFPLPPLAEQKRIVAKIDELMALCDKLENQIELATAKQTALFDAVLAKV